MKNYLKYLDVKTYGYKVNKLLTNTMFFLMVSYFILMCVSSDVNPLEEHIYISCPEDTNGLCFNPLYNPYGYKDYEKVEFLSAGESIGEYVEYNIFFKTFTRLLLSTMILTFSLNHSLYNKNFKFPKEIKGCVNE